MPVRVEYLNDQNKKVIKEVEVKAFRCMIDYTSEELIYKSRSTIAMDSYIFCSEFGIDYALPQFEECIDGRQIFKIRTNRFIEIPICVYCGGSGKIDWARRPRGGKAKGHITFIGSGDIRQGSVGDNKFIKAQNMPLLYEEEKYCTRCGATGINFSDYHAAFGKVFWYKNAVIGINTIKSKP